MTGKSQQTKEAKITEVANELTQEQLDKFSAGAIKIGDIDDENQSSSSRNNWVEVFSYNHQTS